MKTINNIRFFLYISHPSGMGSNAEAHIGRFDKTPEAAAKIFGIKTEELNSALVAIRRSLVGKKSENDGRMYYESTGFNTSNGKRITVNVIAEDGIYEEVHVNRGRSPTFPDQCPVCGAPVFIKKVLTRTEEVRYSCGGGYEEKSQIQNHTDKWWGVCGKFIKGDK